MDTSFALRSFKPAWWLRGAHGQTIVGRLLRKARRVRYFRERISTPDGDFLDLDLTEPLTGTPGEVRPIVLLLHGLQGSSESGYMVEAARLCATHGLRAAALNFRGRSGEPNRRPRANHAGETGDLRHLLRTFRGREPAAPLAAIGFSLGGNVLLKYLGEIGRSPTEGDGQATLEAAAAVSVPFDLAESTARMGRGIGRLYSQRFLRSLRRGVRARAALGALPYDREAALGARTLQAFDEAVTAPLHGFRDAEDYYEQSSSQQYLSAIRVPTLLLQAKDDPFMPASPDLEAAIRENPALHPGLVRRGGHVGFVEGPAPWRARLWAEAEAVRFVATALGAPGA